jgi:hypothetical protein
MHEYGGNINGVVFFCSFEWRHVTLGTPLPSGHATHRSRSRPTLPEIFASRKVLLVTSTSKMGQPQGRKSRKHTNGNHPLHRTRNYGRDVDQIHADLSSKQKTLLKNTAADEDKPGLGIWYCIECARWFVDESTLTKHKSTKVHKRRLSFFS